MILSEWVSAQFAENFANHSRVTASKVSAPAIFSAFRFALGSTGGRGSGGASRDRTDDLFHAMEALSQLSYGPVRKTLYLKGLIPPA
jgi:hypothetical protein